MSNKSLYLLIALLVCVMLGDQILVYTNAVPALLRKIRFDNNFPEYYAHHPLMVYFGYACGFFILTSLGVPGLRYLLIAAGSMLDLCPAIMISSIMGTLGTLPGYFTGMLIFKASLQSRYADLILRMRPYVEKDALSYLFALRMSALMPNMFINLIFGSAQFTKWPTYITVSFLGLFPNVLFYTCMGHLLRSGAIGPLWSRIDLLLIAISIMPFLLKRMGFFKRFGLSG